MKPLDILAKKYELYPLEGGYKQVIGLPEKGFSMILYGLPGGRKSTFSVALGNYLAGFGAVLYVSLEMGYGYTLQDIVKRVGATSPNLTFADKIEGKKGEFSGYEFVIIDSASYVGLNHTHIQQLKKAYPKTSFIYIYQSTKEGNFRGGNEIAHEVDVVLKAENGTIKTVKSRFGGNGEVKVEDVLKTPKNALSLGKIEDTGDVPGLSTSDEHWAANRPQIIFTFNNKSVRKGNPIPASFMQKYMGESEDIPVFLIERYNLRAFEFGKWTTEEDRLNYMYGLGQSLYDLETILDTPNLGRGVLSVCFGSRGVPKASGHFDTKNLLINLSRYNRIDGEKIKSKEENERGSGYAAMLLSRGIQSFAHEFGHFIDFVAGTSEGSSTFASGGRTSVISAMKEADKDTYPMHYLAQKAIHIATGNGQNNLTEYGKRLYDSDGETPYYTLRAEVWARVFEKYVNYKMKKEGFYNLFFAKFKHENGEVKDGTEGKAVYMTDKEFQVIEPIMDEFFQAYRASIEKKPYKVKGDYTTTTATVIQKHASI